MKRIATISTCLVIIAILVESLAYADLSVHYIDVGQGDAALIICDGKAMLVDGGPTSASQLIYSYLRQNVTSLEYIIATHPHEDHIGGLAAALNAVPVEIIFSPVETWNNGSFMDIAIYADMLGTPIIVPNEGDYFHLGDAVVTILHCWPEAWDENDMSIVARIDYGNTSFLFTGDAEDISEYMMVDSGMPLQADVLKVGHHGSHSSTTKEFVSNVMPKYAVISCGAENSYGHPHEETLQNLQGIEVLRTDQLGTIVFHTDGTTLSYKTERIKKAAPFPEKGSTETAIPETEAAYVGNKNSMKFHYPNCSGAQSMKSKNKVYFSSREEAINQGYLPCGKCEP